MKEKSQNLFSQEYTSVEMSVCRTDCVFIDGAREKTSSKLHLIPTPDSALDLVSYVRKGYDYFPETLNADSENFDLYCMKITNTEDEITFNGSVNLAIGVVQNTENPSNREHYDFVISAVKQEELSTGSFLTISEKSSIEDVEDFVSISHNDDSPTLITNINTYSGEYEPPSSGYDGVDEFLTFVATSQLSQDIWSKFSENIDTPNIGDSPAVDGGSPSGFSSNTELKNITGEPTSEEWADMGYDQWYLQGQAVLRETDTESITNLIKTNLANIKNGHTKFIIDKNHQLYPIGQDDNGTSLNCDLYRKIKLKGPESNTTTDNVYKLEFFPESASSNITLNWQVPAEWQSRVSLVNYDNDPTYGTSTIVTIKYDEGTELDEEIEFKFRLSLSGSYSTQSENETTYYYTNTVSFYGLSVVELPQTANGYITYTINNPIYDQIDSSAQYTRGSHALFGGNYPSAYFTNSDGFSYYCKCEECGNTIAIKRVTDLHDSACLNENIRQKIIRENSLYDDNFRFNWYHGGSSLEDYYVFHTNAGETTSGQDGISAEQFNSLVTQFSSVGDVLTYCTTSYVSESANDGEVETECARFTYTRINPGDVPHGVTPQSNQTIEGSDSDSYSVPLYPTGSELCPNENDILNGEPRYEMYNSGFNANNDNYFACCGETIEMCDDQLYYEDRTCNEYFNNENFSVTGCGANLHADVEIQTNPESKVGHAGTDVLARASLYVSAGPCPLLGKNVEIQNFNKVVSKLDQGTVEIEVKTPIDLAGENTLGSNYENYIQEHIKDEHGNIKHLSGENVFAFEKYAYVTEEDYENLTVHYECDLVVFKEDETTANTATIAEEPTREVVQTIPIITGNLLNPAIEISADSPSFFPVKFTWTKMIGGESITEVKTTTSLDYSNGETIEVEHGGEINEINATADTENSTDVTLNVFYSYKKDGILVQTPPAYKTVSIKDVYGYSACVPLEDIEGSGCTLTSDNSEIYYEKIRTSNNLAEVGTKTGYKAELKAYAFYPNSCNEGGIDPALDFGVCVEEARYAYNDSYIIYSEESFDDDVYSVGFCECCEECPDDSTTQRILSEGKVCCNDRKTQTHTISDPHIKTFFNETYDL